jgi:hypothetical protein
MCISNAERLEKSIRMRLGILLNDVLEATLELVPQLVLVPIANELKTSTKAS